jgi:hypothetical protein
VAKTKEKVKVVDHFMYINLQAEAECEKVPKTTIFGSLKSIAITRGS